MPLVGSFIMPHGAIALSKTDPSVPPSAHNLHDACMKASKQINDLQPDIIFLTTPHGISLSEDYAIYTNAKASGTAEWLNKWQEYTCEVEIAQETSQALCDCLSSVFKTQDIRFQTISSYSPNESVILRWGEVIPIWFIQQHRNPVVKAPKYIFFSMPLKRYTKTVEMIPELFQIGKNVRDFFAEMKERVVVVISADLAHTHQHSYPDHPTPFGLNENAELMDATLEKWASTLDVSLLHVEAAKYVDTYVCGFTGFVCLSGMMANEVKWKSVVLAREHPTYYGMMVVSLLPSPPHPPPSSNI